MGVSGFLAAAVLGTSILFASPATAAETGTPLDELRASLVAASATGDPVAAANVVAFDALTPAQRTELTAVLTGNSDASAAGPTADATIVDTASGTVAVDGDAQWVTTDSATPPPPADRKDLSHTTAVYTRSIWGTQWFKFAGITMTETKVWGKYKTSGSRVTSVVDWGSYLVRNYQPLTAVQVNNHSAVISGGTVTFKAKVRVDRGPVPQLGFNWSSKEQYHSVTGNYNGAVTSNRMG
jgi:hypothetical protein